MSFSIDFFFLKFLSRPLSVRDVNLAVVVQDTVGIEGMAGKIVAKVVIHDLQLNKEESS